MAQILIRAERLSKRYGEEGQAIQVFSELDLDIRRAERIAIIGESGVGKTTLLHILGTLDRPSTGKVWLDGHDVFTLPSEELAGLRNREIGFIFQFHHLLPDFNAVENVMLPGLIARLSRAEAKRRAVEILEQVGLTDRLTHRPGELSGGEQQRVAVARALVLRPRVVLADEPTGNLDPGTGEGVLQLLLKLNQAMNITMVVVTHNDKVATSMDRTLRLEAGRLREIQARVETDAVSAGPRLG
ncbi:MAG: ATP-binding cassette domain-containing protein [Desulfurellaceae bacterium]|nr:ATP-binding cassette domain-containing protein [Desulfurellaceae bacterium]